MKASVKKPIPAKTIAAPSPLASTLKSPPAWMRTGDKIQKEIKRNAAETAAMSVPTFWLQDGEVKSVRFLTSDPLAAIYQYGTQIRGKYRSFTQPAPGLPDPFAEAGLNPRLVMIYEIIDITGYTDKKTNKTNRNLRRFWVVGARLDAQLQAIRRKFNGLTKFNIEVTRDGAGTSTTYQLIPEPPTPAPTSKDKPLAPEMERYFAPLGTERIRAMLGVTAAPSEDTSEDTSEE